MSRLNNLAEIRVNTLDLDAARLYLRELEHMAGEGARSRDARVVLLALCLVEIQASRARALARAA